MNDRHGLILASGSRTRRELLQAAGIAFIVEPADIDERAIRMAQPHNAEPAKFAETLAQAKAQTISQVHPEALVIGADQILSQDDEIHEKPRDIESARATLMRLRGRTHQLYTSVALAEAGKITWSATDKANLSMRDFSQHFVDEYLARAGNSVLESLGGYQVESVGLQLFETIDGDYFSILGLPMMALLKELRARKVVLE